jgi:hypothetical protein
MLPQEIIHKSVDELHEALVDILEDTDLSKAKKKVAWADTLEDWRLHVKSMDEGFVLAEKARETAKPNLKLVSDLSKTEIRKDKPMTALQEITAKASELRKQDPKLTKEMAFTQAYLNPGNRALAQRYRDEQRVAKTPMLSQSDGPDRMPPGDPVPGNDATHPTRHAAIDGGAGGTLDSHPQGVGAADSIDRLYSKYKEAVPGLTAACSAIWLATSAAVMAFLIPTCRCVRLAPPRRSQTACPRSLVP